MPLFPEGDPGSAPMKELRACEAATIEYMIRTLGDGWERYLSFYFLANWSEVHPSQWLRPEELGGSKDKKWIRHQMLARHQRYMIYVHTKLMIVDDRYVILGSCNLNDRGLMGDGDSEICASIWPMLKKQKACIEKVRDLRKQLWEEHFGSGMPTAWEMPEKEACWQAARKQGFANYKAFREMTRKGAKGHICLLNFVRGKERIEVKEKDVDLDVGDRIEGPEPNQSLPDAPYSKVKDAGNAGWNWKGRFKTIVPRFLVE